MVSYDARVSRYHFSPSNPPLLSFLVLLICLSGWPAIINGQPIGDLKTPQCFIVSPSGQYYFIANANGDPGKRDNNGFISKLNTDGELIDLHFIHGGTRGTLLHSPNGMAIVGKTLYVADLDSVRGFDINTGQSTVTLSFSQFHVTELTDLIADGSGQLFVLDTEGNAIYQIDTTQDHIVSLYLHNDDLASPRGLAVHPKSGRLVVVSHDMETAWLKWARAKLKKD